MTGPTDAPNPAVSAPDATLARQVAAAPAGATNAARRLVALLERIRACLNLNSQTPMIDVWATIFALDRNETRVQTELEIARMLRVVLSETLAVRSALIDAKIAHDAYEGQLQAVADILSVAQLPQGVQAVCGAVLETPRAVLHAFAQMLPVEEEPVLDAATLADALARLREMQTRMHDEVLSPVLRTYFDRQLDRMIGAVREYPVRGAAAFRDAAEQTIVSLTVDPPASDQFTDSDIAAAARWREQIADWWRKFERVATRAVLVGDSVALLLSGKPVIIALTEPPRQLSAQAELKRLQSGALAPADETAVHVALPSGAASERDDDCKDAGTVGDIHATKLSAKE